MANSNHPSYGNPPPQAAVVENNAFPSSNTSQRTANRPRMGSSLARTQPRKSPATSRHDNLQETLNDLLENEELLAGEVVVEDGEPLVGNAIASDQNSSDLEEDEVFSGESIASDAMPAETEDYLDETPVIEESLAEDTPLEESVVEDAPREVVEKAIVENLQADETEFVETPELLAAESEPAVPTEVANETVEAAEPTIAHAKIDLHDALLSDELYEDALVEEEAPEEVAMEPAESITESISEEPAESLEPEDLMAIDIPEPEQQPLPLDPVAEIPEPIETIPDTQPEPLAQLDDQPLVTAEEDDEPIVSEERVWEAQPAEPSSDQNRHIPVAGHPSGAVENEPSYQGRPKPITRLRKPGEDVLVSSEQPVIVSHVEGPSSILVGREASYRVTLENTSRTTARNLSAVVHVPHWADLVDVECTSGVVRTIQNGDGGLDWQLSELAARSSHTIHLRLIPRSGRKFQLGVQWNQDSVESQATVEVREPKLEIKISGPQEVLFGSAQRYRLTLSNPGTGSAEGVAVSLIPPGSDSSEAATHTVGTLGPEEVKELELELTAREAGELILQANATADGGLQAEAIRRVLCRKPELEIDWRGPDRKYAGTETAYYFRIRNSGTATTEPVEVKARLPEGIRFLSASDSYAVDSVTGVVTWKLSSLTPGEEQFVQFQCELDRPGLREFEVAARTIEGDVHDTTSVRTEVVALADLKLDVNDPRGARPIGEPVLYEIRVENRGSTDARGISIVGLFSEGIDPVSVEGAQNSVRDGRVTFQPVKSLPAGGEILLRIRAVASQVGTHIFRAEVVCDDLDIRLAAEETTRFFEDEFHWDEGETPYTAEKPTRTRLR